MQHSASQALLDARKNLPAEVYSLSEHAIQIDSMKRQAARERPESQREIAIQIHLSDFNEATIVAQQADAFGDRVTRQGVQHHVHSFTVGGLPDLFRKAQRTRVEDVSDPQASQ